MEVAQEMEEGEEPRAIMCKATRQGKVELTQRYLRARKSCALRPRRAELAGWATCLSFEAAAAAAGTGVDIGRTYRKLSLHDWTSHARLFGSADATNEGTHRRPPATCIFVPTLTYPCIP